MSRIDQLQQMIQEDPNDVFLQYALGLELLNTSVERALIQFEQVITLDETYVPAYYQLGQALVQKNDKEKGLEYLRKGQQLAVQQKNKKAAGEFDEVIFLAED